MAKATAAVKGAALAKQILGRLWGGTKATGRVARKGAVLGTVGAVGLGVNPFLAAGLGKLLGGMGGGKGSLGAGGGLAGVASGAVGPGAGRDSSIVAGMTPLPEYKGPTFSKLSKSVDFRTAIHHVAELGRVNYLVNLANNKGIVRIQQMLQGPTAARAKELRMESGKALAPIIIMPGGGGGEEKGGGMNLPLLAAAIAGLLGGALAGASGRGESTTGGGAADIIDKAWWDKPQNRYATNRNAGKYWKSQQVKGPKISFKNTKFDPRRWPGQIFQRIAVVVDGKPIVDTVAPETVVEKVVTEALKPITKPQGRVYTGKMPLFTQDYAAMGTGRSSPLMRNLTYGEAGGGPGQRGGRVTGLSRFFMSDFGGDQIFKEPAKPKLGEFTKWVAKSLAPGVVSAGDAGMSDAWYADRGQLTLSKGDGAVKVTGGKVTFPRLIIDWAPGGLEANLSGGRSISTTSKAPTGTTATGTRIVDIPPGEGLSGRIPYKGARGSFYEGRRVQTGQGFTQGRPAIGRRALTASEVTALRNAGLRVGAPAADGVRMIHEFDEGRWKTAGTKTINAVIGTQRPKALQYDVGGRGAIDAATRSTGPGSWGDTFHQTRISTAKTIPGGGAAAVETKIGSMPPGKGLTGYRGAPGTFGATRGRPDFKTTSTVGVEEFIRRAEFFEKQASRGIPSRVMNWLRKTFGKGKTKSNLVRGFNVGLYAGIVAWYAYRRWGVPPEGVTMGKSVSWLVGEHVTPLSPEEFKEKVAILTIAFAVAIAAAGILAAAIVAALTIALPVFLGTTAAFLLIGAVGMIGGAIASMIAHVAAEDIVQKEIYKEGGVWSVLIDPNAVPTAVSAASKTVMNMIKGLLGSAGRWTFDKISSMPWWIGGKSWMAANREKSAVRTAMATNYAKSDFAMPPSLSGTGKAPGMNFNLDWAPSPPSRAGSQGTGGVSMGAKYPTMIGLPGTTSIMAGSAAVSSVFNFKGAKDWVSGWFSKPTTTATTTPSSTVKETINYVGPSLQVGAVNPKLLYDYLRTKRIGKLKVDHIHAIGMLTNIEAESSYKTGAIGDNGNSGGLFQWNGSRFREMKRFVGKNWADKSSYKKQIDFAFSAKDEGPTTLKHYLEHEFLTVEEAVIYFYVHWERALNSDKKQKQDARADRSSHHELLQSFVQPTSRSGLSRRTESKRDSSKAITIPGHWRHSTQGRRTVKEWVPEVTIPPSALNMPGGGGGQTIINNITNSSDAGTQQLALTVDANPYNQFGGPLSPLSGQGDYDTTLGLT